MAEGAVLLRFSVRAFETVLRVVMGDRVADDLSNKILVVCTPPREGAIEVALSPEEARTLIDAVAASVDDDPDQRPILDLLRGQAL
ncbi:MAG: hypothetical protein FJ033_07465 [Chloroflexi bacterium]|nr:hypothetical protein [Chloroflexota bacterium]